MSQTVDAHHHLWRYTPHEFAWLEGALAPLRRDFLLSDLDAAMQSASIDATVVVQARQTLEETRWLLELAAQTRKIAGVVGWVPLASSEFPEILGSLLHNTLLKGLRHVLQGEPDPNFMLREDFNRGISSLLATNLVYDILIYERQLTQTTQLVDRHPHQVFVLDHIAKPRIAEQALEPWEKNLRELALRPNVFCKISGLVTEADPLGWTPAQFKPYLDVVVEAFGPSRLLAGSDWPVCLAGVAYDRWFQVLHDFFASYTSDERADIFGDTATRAYGLAPRTGA